jgi:hypothetical protein
MTEEIVPITTKKGDRYEITYFKFIDRISQGR